MLCAEPAMKPECRNALLAAIAKARGWVDDIRLGCIGSFAKIAENEALGERHIRLLAPLADLCQSMSLPVIDPIISHLRYCLWTARRHPLYSSDGVHQ
jgi:hypothetical protein